MLENFLAEHRIPFERNVSLKKKTWIKTGGQAGYWITPTDEQQLIELALFLHRNGIPFEVVGHTSNLYFLDEYNPGVVVSTVKMAAFRETSDGIVCACGTPVVKLAGYCVDRGIAGFSGLVNLPGTVAAAVCNNSGCFGSHISECLESVRFVSFEGEGRVLTLTREQLACGHRTSALKRKELHGVIVSVLFRKQWGDRADELRKAEQARAKRKATQEGPLNNLGSVHASLTLRRNLRNFIARGIGSVCFRLHRSDSQRIWKRTLLFLYGYSDLKDCISDKNINTFLWGGEFLQSGSSVTGTLSAKPIVIRC